MRQVNNLITEGNIIFNKIDENGIIHIQLNKEFNTTTHWFLFKVLSRNFNLNSFTFSIDNANSSLFSKGWNDYAPFISYDYKKWERIKSGTFINNSFIFNIKNCGRDFFVAYYSPYSLEYYYEWLNGISSKIQIIRNGILPDFITLGDKLKPSVVLVARQHPGETMASFAIEGFIDYLIKENILTKHFLNNFSLIIFPLLNKGGVKKGYHRLNTNGVDLNRSWKSNNVDEITFVKNVLNNCSSIYSVIDIHGDEVSGLNYIYYKKSECTLLQLLKEQSPSIIPIPKQSAIKRFVKHLIYRGKILNIFKATLSDYATKKYHAKSYTIEISAKSMSIDNCREIGKNIAYALFSSLSD